METTQCAGRRLCLLGMAEVTCTSLKQHAPPALKRIQEGSQDMSCRTTHIVQPGHSQGRICLQCKAATSRLPASHKCCNCGNLFMACGCITCQGPGFICGVTSTGHKLINCAQNTMHSPNGGLTLPKKGGQGSPCIQS